MPSPPPFVFRPARPGCPVLVAVAHAGRDYPAPLLALARGGRAALEGLEDPLVDELAAGAVGAGTVGAGLVAARLPRAWVDLNRAPDDLDPAAVRGALRLQPTARARSGLGVVPTRLPGAGPLWRRPLSPSELAARIAGTHAPYHRAIAAELERIRDAEGAAILLDLHSMPPLPDGTAVIVGDRHGTSCDGALARAALATAAAHGLSARANAPYAGGHAVSRHGDPVRAIHALQVELSRDLYLDGSGRRPGPGWARTAAFVSALAAALAGALGTPDWRQAAE